MDFTKNATNCLTLIPVVLVIETVGWYDAEYAPCYVSILRGTNDFLPDDLKKRDIQYAFERSTAIATMLERCGNSLAGIPNFSRD